MKYKTIKQIEKEIAHKRAVEKISYIPKANKKKVIIGSILIAVCLTTLGTNWMIPFIGCYAFGKPINSDKYLIKLRRLRHKLR